MEGAASATRARVASRSASLPAKRWWRSLTLASSSTPKPSAFSRVRARRSAWPRNSTPAEVNTWISVVFIVARSPGFSGRSGFAGRPDPLGGRRRTRRQGALIRRWRFDDLTGRDHRRVVTTRGRLALGAQFFASGGEELAQQGNGGLGKHAAGALRVV